MQREDIKRIYKPFSGKTFEKSYYFDAEFNDLGVLSFYLDDTSMQLSCKYKIHETVKIPSAEPLPPALQLFSEMVSLTGLVVGIDLKNFEKIGLMLGRQLGEHIDYSLQNLRDDLKDDIELFRTEDYDQRVVFPNELFISRLYPLKP